MQPFVSARRGPFNDGRKSSSTAAVYHVVAARVSSPDAITVVLRGDYAGPLEAAKRHAVGIARVVAERYRCTALAEVLDGGNCPLHVVEVKK